MLCNRCKKIEMELVGYVHPRGYKGLKIDILEGTVRGKPKYRCPMCGYEKIGGMLTMADIQEKKMLDKN